MKILFVNANLVNGGAEKMMAWLSGYLSTEHEITFLTFRDMEEDFQKIPDGVKRVSIDYEKKRGKIIPSMRTVARMHNLLRKNEYDFAIAFLSPSQLRLAIASRGTKTKILFSHRGDPLRVSGNKLAKSVNEVAFSLADYFVFQTEGAKKCFNSKIQSKACVIPNPVLVTRKEYKMPIKRDNRIVNVARLDITQKRQDLLIEAFNMFCSYNEDYTLDLYGDGKDYERIKELAQNNEKIVFHGAVKNVVDVIKNASMFVLTSDYEGIPNALIEAMAAGIPSISTNCTPGGAAMLLKNYENGILVPCGDSEAICKAMLFYANNAVEAEKCAEQAKKIVYEYSEQRVGNMWLNLIENM